jgi:predicted protein tyrosine phosphatase
MPFQEIDFISQSEMHYIHKGRDDTIVISIRNSGRDSEPARVAAGFKDVLYMAFDNNRHLSHHEVRFSLKHAEEILDYVAKYEGQATRILVNCLAGESRSAAVASYLSEKYGVPLAADRSLDHRSEWVHHVLEVTDERRQRPPVKPGMPQA